MLVKHLGCLGTLLEYSHQLATSATSVIQGFYKLLVAHQAGFSVSVWLLTHCFEGLCWEQVKGCSSISLSGRTFSCSKTTVSNMTASSLTPSLCLVPCRNSEMHRRGFCGHCSSLSQHFHQHHCMKHSEHKQASPEQPSQLSSQMGEELRPPKEQCGEWVWWHGLGQHHPSADLVHAKGHNRWSMQEMWVLRKTRC